MLAKTSLENNWSSLASHTALKCKEIKAEKLKRLAQCCHTPWGGVFLCSSCQLKPNPSSQELYRCQLNQEFSLIQGQEERENMGSYRENHWDTVVVLIHLNSERGDL